MAVALRGALAVNKALKKYSPELAKEMRREIAAVLRPIANEAKGYVPSASPMSGWAERSFSEARFPFYNVAQIRKGIGYKTTPSKVNPSGWRSLASLRNMSGVGAIYESAGRTNPQGQPWVGKNAGGTGKGVSRSTNKYAGKQFIANLGTLSGEYPNKGRLIGRAWHNNEGKAKVAVIKAITAQRKKFTADVTVVRNAA